MPELQALHEMGVKVVGVSVDGPADEARVRPYLKRLGVTYPVYLGGEVAIEGVFYGAPELPMSLLVDENGHIIDAFTGWGLKTQQRMASVLSP
jgi:peroxiredoxin